MNNWNLILEVVKKWNKKILNKIKNFQKIFKNLKISCHAHIIIILEYISCYIIYPHQTYPVNLCLQNPTL